MRRQIRKAGMVIPEVFEVVKSKRPPGAEEFDLFKHIGGKCPACGGVIAKDKIKTGGADLPLGLGEMDAQQRVPTEGEEVAWRCQNIAGCPAQQTRRLEHFAQRKALDERIQSFRGYLEFSQPTAAALKSVLASKGIAPAFTSDLETVAPGRQVRGEIEYLFAVNVTPRAGYAGFGTPVSATANLA